MNDTVKSAAENCCPSCHRALSSKALEGLCPACLLREGEQMDTEASEASRGKPGRFQPPSLEDLERLFPKLEVMRLLGAGGMGAVYLARQRDLGRLVALKVLPADAEGGTRFSERFNREARALARLNHPNIVAVYEFGSAGSLLYFLMEFVDGANLRQLQRAGRLSPREALQIVPQICDALQYAHDEGVVHRDIKPENVLLDRKGRVKIADFGLAKLAGGTGTGMGARLTLEGQVMGTPHYMAPEQVEHPGEVDHRADIYALGVVFYELLTGDLPLGKFAPPSRKVAIDVRLDDIVMRALENDPARRYQHASEVKQQVERVETNTVEPDAETSAMRENPVSTQAPPQFLRWMGIPVVRERDGEREVQFNAALGALILCMTVVASAHYLLRFLTRGEPAGAGWMVPMGVMVMIWGIRRALNQPKESELRAEPGTGLATLRSGRKHGRAGDVLMLVLLWFACVGVHVAGVALLKLKPVMASDTATLPAAAPVGNVASAAPSYAQRIVDPSTPRVDSMEPPELRFLTWQYDWDTQGPRAARTYVGNRQVDLVDIETLKQIRPGRLVQTNHSHAHVWICHPSFDGNSLVSVEPLDKRGEWVDSGLEGNAYSGMGVQLTQNGSVFWILSTFELSTDNGASARRGLRVRYAVGELENVRGIEPMNPHGVRLDNGASVLDIGQSVLGHAFVSLTGDFDRSQRQFVARVLTTSGELLDSSAIQRTGFHDGGRFRVQRFEFGVPLDRVAEFRVGSRPVLTHVWDKVELPLIPPPPLDTKGKVSLPPEREFLPERFEDSKPRPTARVEADGSGDYKTLQEALDALPPHSWIQLGSGRFSETLRILKPVWISGQGESTVLTSREPWREPTAAELGEYRDRRQAATSSEARQAMEAEFVARFHRPVVEVSLGDRAVAKLRHLRVTLRGIPPDGALSPVAAVSVASGTLELVGCGVVGSAGNGIIVAAYAEVKLSDCLVAAAWNVGIAAGPRSKAKVWNSVIRNCFYAGITAGAAAALEVRDSWISGAAWHGIRYDNASPSIHNCWIEGNARSGVYASGTTRAQLFGNWFVGNGMSGVSCWMDNRDAIERNTFFAQPREALALVGSAAPTVKGNIFLTNHIALLQSRIQGKPVSEPRPPKLRRNLFHGNHTNAVWAANSSGEYPTIEIGSKGADETESLFMDPGLTDPGANRLEPVHGLSAHTHQIGAPSAALQRGRFELQPEEIAMIPEGDDRDSKRWKRRQP